MRTAKIWKIKWTFCPPVATIDSFEIWLLKSTYAFLFAICVIETFENKIHPSLWESSTGANKQASWVASSCGRFDSFRYVAWMLVILSLFRSLSFESVDIALDESSQNISLIQQHFTLITSSDLSNIYWEHPSWRSHNKWYHHFLHVGCIGRIRNPLVRM
jgi:hypothetical protein